MALNFAGNGGYVAAFIGRIAVLSFPRRTNFNNITSGAGGIAFFVNADTSLIGVFLADFVKEGIPDIVAAGGGSGASGGGGATASPCAPDYIDRGSSVSAGNNIVFA